MRSMLSGTENLKVGGWLEFWDTGVGGTTPGAWLGCNWSKRFGGCDLVVYSERMQTQSYVNTRFNYSV